MEVVDPVPKKKRLPPYVYDRAGQRIRVISTPYVLSFNEAQKTTKPSQTLSNPNGLQGSPVDLSPHNGQDEANIRKCHESAEKASTSKSCERMGELPSTHEETVDMACGETRSTNPEEQLQPQEQAYTSIVAPPPSSSSIWSSTSNIKNLKRLINIQPVATSSKFNAKLKTYLRTPDGKRIRIETKNVQILDKVYASV